MTVATLRLDLRFRLSLSSKETRRQMRGIMDKLRKHFNVSVAETELGDDPRSAILVVATVSRTRRDVHETLERVFDAVSAHPRAEILDQTLTEV
jgi:uncharacterized protein YlxP (DUF503 family)